MIPLYILMAILAGPEVVAEASGGKNYIVFAIMQGITFCVGLFILLTGVRLLIAELVPAFVRHCEKLYPAPGPHWIARFCLPMRQMQLYTALFSPL